MDCERRCHIPFCFRSFSFKPAGKQAPAVPDVNSQSSKLVQELISIFVHKYDRKYIAVTYPILCHTSYDPTHRVGQK